MNGNEIEDIIYKKVVDWINGHAPLKVKALIGAIGAGILGFFLFMMAGCLNVRMHANGRVHRSYTGTKANVEAMEISFNHGGEGWLLLIPLAVDLPLEVVADTVTLPFDIMKK